MNINIGPGDTSWLSTPEEYWPALDELCKKNRVNYLEDPWWPAIEELIDAGIPVHRYIQRPGDIGLFFIYFICSTICSMTEILLAVYPEAHIVISLSRVLIIYSV